MVVVEGEVAMSSASAFWDVTAELCGEFFDGESLCRLGAVSRRFRGAAEAMWMHRGHRTALEGKLWSAGQRRRRRAVENAARGECPGSSKSSKILIRSFRDVAFFTRIAHGDRIIWEGDLEMIDDGDQLCLLFDQAPTWPDLVALFKKPDPDSAVAVFRDLQIAMAVVRLADGAVLPFARFLVPGDAEALLENLTSQSLTAEPILAPTVFKPPGRRKRFSSDFFLRQACAAACRETNRVPGLHAVLSFLKDQDDVAHLDAIDLYFSWGFHLREQHHGVADRFLEDKDLLPSDVLALLNTLRWDSPPSPPSGLSS